MKNTICIIILSISNIITACIQKQNDTLEIWTCSIGNFVSLNAEKFIEDKYPFKIKAVAGDVLSHELIETIDNHNNQVWSYLYSIGYNGIKEDYNSELKAEINRIQKAIEISKSHKKINKLYLKLKKQNLEEHTKLVKTNDNNYSFRVYSFNLDKIETNEILEMEFVVDPINNKIKIVK